MMLAWLPNALTMARCVFAGLVLWGVVKATGIDAQIAIAAPGSDDATRLTVLQQLWYQFALLGFLSGALTDFLDGWAARQFNASSRFGIWLDPIADKLLVGLALLGLALVFKTWIVSLPAALIIARDVFMTWLRTRPEGRSVVVPTGLAKLKTGIEMVAIIGLMLPLALLPSAIPAYSAAPVSNAGRVAAAFLVGMLWLAAGLSLETARRYVLAIRKK